MTALATLALAWIALTAQTPATPTAPTATAPTPTMPRAQTPPSAPTSPIDLAPGPDSPRAHIEAVPDHAHIGEPIDLMLVIEHAKGASITLPDPHTLPRTLALIQDLGLRRNDDPNVAGRTITRAHWRVMALEGGDVTIPPLAVTVEQDGKNTPISVALPKVTIEAALQPHEDAPRAARGFRDTPRVHMWSLRGIVTALSIAIVALIAATVVWKRRARRKLMPIATVTPLDRLTALETRARAEPDAARTVIYALTALLRETVDARSSMHRNALTDADWSSAVANDANVPEVVRATVARLLAAAERVKYAQESPSTLAVRDWMEQARKALEALGEPPRIAA